MPAENRRGRRPANPRQLGDDLPTCALDVAHANPEGLSQDLVGMLLGVDQAVISRTQHGETVRTALRVLA